MNIKFVNGRVYTAETITDKITTMFYELHYTYINFFIHISNTFQCLYDVTATPYYPVYRYVHMRKYAKHKHILWKPKYII